MHTEFWLGKFFYRGSNKFQLTLKTETNLNYTYNFSSYLKGNTVRATIVAVENQKYCIF